MRLYHHPLSSCSRRAVMTAIHLGIPVERVIVDITKGEQRSADYVALNPNARVPTLVDGDFVLWESHAIQQYLAENTPGQDLYPADVRGRADVNRWLFWSANHFGPAIGVLNRENMIKRMMGLGAGDPAEIQRGEQLVTDCARTLDTHLANREWLALGHLTLADFAVAAPLMSTEPAKLPVKDFAHLQRWFARVRELDAWKQTSP